VDELDALDTYNGYTEHDMWVDFDNFENTGSPNVLWTRPWNFFV